MKKFWITLISICVICLCLLLHSFLRAEEYKVELSQANTDIDFANEKALLLGASVWQGDLDNKTYYQYDTNLICKVRIYHLSQPNDINLVGSWTKWNSFNPDYDVSQRLYSIRHNIEDCLNKVIGNAPEKHSLELDIHYNYPLFGVGFNKSIVTQMLSSSDTYIYKQFQRNPQIKAFSTYLLNNEINVLIVLTHI